MPQCPKCWEKWDLADEYDACPNCGGGGSDIKLSGLGKALLWVGGALLLIAILVAVTR